MEARACRRTFTTTPLTGNGRFLIVDFIFFRSQCSTRRADQQAEMSQCSTAKDTNRHPRRASCRSSPYCSRRVGGLKGGGAFIWSLWWTDELHAAENNTKKEEEGNTGRSAIQDNVCRWCEQLRKNPTLRSSVMKFFGWTLSYISQNAMQQTRLCALTVLWSSELVSEPKSTSLCRQRNIMFTTNKEITKNCCVFSSWMPPEVRLTLAFNVLMSIKWKDVKPGSAFHYICPHHTYNTFVYFHHQLEKLTFQTWRHVWSIKCTFKSQKH